MKQDYKKLFMEANEPVNMAPPATEAPAPEVSDTDHWNAANPEIANNEELANQFNVEGLPADVTQQYVEKIKNWRDNIEKVSAGMEDIYKFASENADKPGAGEIFSSIGGLVEGIMTDFGTLEGQLRSLGNKINVAMKRENEKSKGR